jgi:hypothetical protein
VGRGLRTDARRKTGNPPESASGFRGRGNDKKEELAGLLLNQLYTETESGKQRGSSGEAEETAKTPAAKGQKDRKCCMQHFVVMTSYLAGRRKKNPHALYFLCHSQQEETVGALPRGALG